jgi:hypothetical protein
MVRRSTSLLITIRWLIAATVVLFLAWAGWEFKGERTYRTWRNNKRMEGAMSLFQQGKVDEAAVMARAVFDSDNNNVDAIRLIASAAERSSPYAARPWRQRAFDLQPWNLTNRIDLAITYLRIGDAITSRNLLLAVGTNVPTSASFLETLGAASFAVGDMTRAEYGFAQASRLDPSNLDRQFNLAKVLLTLDSPARNAEARQTIDRLSTNPATRVAALTLRIEDALSHKRVSDAVRYAENLNSITNGPFSSRLLHLTALKAAASPKLAPAVASLQKSAVASPLEFSQLAVWMSRNGMSPAAMKWVKSLSPDQLADPSARIAVADLYIGIQDWLGLRQWVRSEDWKSFNAFRLAYDSFASRFLGSAESRATEQDALWQRAIKATEKNPAQLQALSQMALQWKMMPQYEATLWAISEGGISEEAALVELNQLYKGRQDTLGQLKVARRLFALRGSDVSNLNNLVYLGLLLDGADASLQKLADTLHDRSNKDPNHVSTYAFALFRRNQPQKAVEVMNTIDPATLKKPSFAAMMGLFQAHAGNAKAAREHLTLSTGASLLPEEDALVRTAKAMARMTQ